MTEVVMVALIVATPPTIAAVGSVSVSLLNRRDLRIAQRKIEKMSVKVDETTTKVMATTEKLDGIHHQINSRMDELLATAKTGSFAEGKLEGQKPTGR
jgi:hypothetical protein